MPLTLQLYKAHTHTLPLTGPYNDCRRRCSIICENGMVDVRLLSVSGRSCRFFLTMLSALVRLFSPEHTQLPRSICTDNRVIIQITESGPHVRKLWRQKGTFFVCASITRVDLWGLVDGFVRLRSCPNSFANDCMPKHLQKPALICCCIPPHTGTLQTDGCISRGQMMAVFSLYQAPTACSDCMMQLASF